MSLFDLKEAQLRPIVEAISGAPVLSFRIDSAVPLETGQGECGDKLCVDLSYTTHAGLTCSASLFVKKFTIIRVREGREDPPLGLGRYSPSQSFQ